MPQGADEGEAAQQFAAELMDRWGVGDAWCNDGVLLLLTLQPRQVCPQDTTVSCCACTCFGCCELFIMPETNIHFLQTTRHAALSCHPSQSEDEADLDIQESMWL